MTAQAGFHMYGFEVWPDPMPAATYPMLVPGRVTVKAPDYDTARQLAERGIASGQSLGACSHLRASCHPAHPGR